MEQSVKQRFSKNWHQRNNTQGMQTELVMRAIVKSVIKSRK